LGKLGQARLTEKGDDGNLDSAINTLILILNNKVVV